MKIAVYQFNSIVGDLEFNTNKLVNAIKEAQENKADLFVCPELCICGYSPEDLLFRKDFPSRLKKCIDQLLLTKNLIILLPTPHYEKSKIFNSVYVIYNGDIIKRYDKQILPNYEIFDDQRYFTPGSSTCIFNWNSLRIGVLICEDIWAKKPINKIQQLGADLVCVVNASPFEKDKYEKRIQVVTKRATEANLPILYVNCVGGQDDVVYDGASFMTNQEGAICYQSHSFKEKLDYIDFNADFNAKIHTNYNSITTYPPYEERIYTALVISIKDYVYKNGFKGVVLGLSGGIDSALTLALAYDALGSENITAIMMPSNYTSEISLEDAQQMVNNLEIKNYHIIRIDGLLNNFKNSLSHMFSLLPNRKNDVTYENLQARIRGTLLMAISNKCGYLLLTTSNKSETATGYTTLYGDMAGGFAPLKDVLKTTVYALSKWRNSQQNIIPERIIERAPSAELRENQTDQDFLPAYDTLDVIIEYLTEDNLSTEDIIKTGLNKNDVLKIGKLLKLNEYKRKQSAIGPKITRRAFTKDWRYPVTSGYEL